MFLRQFSSLCLSSNHLPCDRKIGSYEAERNEKWKLSLYKTSTLKCFYKKNIGDYFLRSSATLHWPTTFSRGCCCYKLLTPNALKLQVGACVCIYMKLYWGSSRRFGFRILHRRLYDITQPTLYHQPYVSASLQCVEKRYCDFIFLPSMERVAFVTLYKALLFTCDTRCLRVMTWYWYL